MPQKVYTFKNGARAVKDPNTGRMRIISGPTKGKIGVSRKNRGGGIASMLPQIMGMLPQIRNGKYGPNDVLY